MGSGSQGILRTGLVAACALLALFLGGAILSAQTGGLDKQAFAKPVLNGVAVDACLTPGSGCGPLAAYQFCRSQGYESAAGWSLAEERQTRSVENGRLCTSGAGVRCSALRNVTCVRPSVPADGKVFPAPTIHDLPVDGCAHFGGGCGQPAADQFCRTQGYHYASFWSSQEDAETWNIGSNRSCQSGPGMRCGGLRNIVCVAGTGGRPRVPGLVAPGRMLADLDSPRIALPGERRGIASVGQRSPVETANAARLETLRRRLSVVEFARFYADLSVTIARYESTIGQAAVPDAVADEREWEASYRAGLASGAASVQSIDPRLRRIDRALLTANRAALAGEIEDVLRKYGG